ncbi:hypothetical protein B446_12990 [Streptomyces collinus Tu 365]|uniref:Uncharacterized protein n=1 Tax=Streptomyces collinus (strain DSM 40733 / Tue 365) TaxID=1214242 RepID=S5UUD4_STRC3|nr:hypothetical protein B446_12990 [Streptomyces collinus Tu 365]
MVDMPCLRWKPIIERIGDVWYPSMDDVVVIDECVGVRRVRILDGLARELLQQPQGWRVGPA